jgi:hypothetical protein
MIKQAFSLALIAGLSALVACNRDSDSAKNDTTPPAKPTLAAPTPAPGSPGTAGHGGGIIELGNAQIGGYAVRASRDVGDIKPGGDAPIDVWLTGGDIAKVKAVRFWIGTQSGDESTKAKADIEIPAEPNHWHTHADVPNPMPPGSKLWVEIETDQGKHVGSFELTA